MSAPTLSPVPHLAHRTGSHRASRPAHRRPTRSALPGIGVGTTVPPTPAIPAGRLTRYRVRADHAGLTLRAGETVLCTPYEPATLGMVVLVRCEADSYAPGALVPLQTLEFLEHTDEVADPGQWSELGRRD